MRLPDLANPPGFNFGYDSTEGLRQESTMEVAYGSHEGLFRARTPAPFGRVAAGSGGRRLALMTKHGRPATLAVPFNERLLQHGVHRAVALDLFEQGQVTLTQGAKLAGIPAEDYIALLGEVGIAAVTYPLEEIAEELKAAI